MKIKRLGTAAVDSVKIFSHLRPMSKSRSLAKISERGLQPLSVQKFVDWKLGFDFFLQGQKGGDMAPCPPAWAYGPDIFSLRKRRTGSLKVITYVRFPPKIKGKPQKRVITSADVHFPPKVKWRTKQPASPPFIRPWTPEKKPWAFASPKKDWLRYYL